jgi:hypothetical protein
MTILFGASNSGVDGPCLLVGAGIASQLIVHCGFSSRPSTRSYRAREPDVARDLQHPFDSEVDGRARDFMYKIFARTPRE